MLSVLKGFFHNLEGSLGIINQLHNHIDFRIKQDVIFLKSECGTVESTMLVAIFYTYLFNLSLDAVCFVEHVIEPLTHATQTQITLTSNACAMKNWRQ